MLAWHLDLGWRRVLRQPTGTRHAKAALPPFHSIVTGHQPMELSGAEPHLRRIYAVWLQAATVSWAPRDCQASPVSGYGGEKCSIGVKRPLATPIIRASIPGGIVWSHPTIHKRSPGGQNVPWVSKQTGGDRVRRKKKPLSICCQSKSTLRPVTRRSGFNRRKGAEFSSVWWGRILHHGTHRDARQPGAFGAACGADSSVTQRQRGALNGEAAEARKQTGGAGSRIGG
ncbi:hypothetical protein VTK56DRAFT_5384 [Thermocarpiscus australiensis]